MTGLGKGYFKLLLWVYVAALAVCGAARVLLMLQFIDYDTGFYTQQTGIIQVFNIALLVTALFLFILSRLRNPGGDYPVYQSSRVAGILSILVGLSIVAYVLLDQPYPPMEQGYSALVIQIRNIASIVLGLLAALSFVLFGAGNLTGRVYRKGVAPALCASIWMVFMLVTRFNSYTTLTTISDNLLAVLFMVAACLFFMGHARTIFGFTRKDGRNYTIPAGLCTSLIGLLLVVPNYIAMGVKSLASIPAPLLGTWESLFVLLTSLYALVFVVGMTRSIKQV